MQTITVAKQGGGYALQNNSKNNPDATVSYTVSGVSSDLGSFHDQWMVQGYEQLLKEHVDRLQTAIRRHESVSLKPFPRYMNQKEVISYLGHEKVFRILVEEYHLQPVREEHKCNIYCSKQVEEKCIQFEFNIAA
ncbi:MAG: hypothetical protein K8R57_03360 [Verrucomicrobia bacterium]|nr:hypothetical protein [Verrucomicrobiota bacterium]